MPIHESIPTLGNVKYQYLFSNGKGLWEKYGALLKSLKVFNYRYTIFCTK